MPTGLYIHIPFCQRKCPYCDFNTYAGLENLYVQTVQALVCELQRWRAELAPHQIDTIFLGGGTPTVLEVEQLAQLLDGARHYTHLSPNAEITSEVNPGAVDRIKFQNLKTLGVNRLSMGVQSFQPDELHFLGRIHNVADVYQAYEAARQAGFDNINLDFMFGLPNQTPTQWRDTLTKALALAPDHLSLYSLIVEPNTPLHQWVASGQVPDTDDDAAADLYEMAMDILGAAGYIHYEVSNWARTEAHACQHNLIYWRNQEYLGIGPGAHSHMRLAQDKQQLDRADTTLAPFADLRWGNRKYVQGYIQRLQKGESVEEFHEALSPAVAMGETMMLGLRLVDEGVPFAHFQQLHNQDLRAVYQNELAQLQEWGLIIQDDARVRLTHFGLMMGNQVFTRFMPSTD
ncbi:MAG: radical SAM family heme chaperone HemW [Caldilineaceae bacterium]|nr:radical SAM family heme chaperone HemW [Caldilineaceae bacterium]